MKTSYYFLVGIYFVLVALLTLKGRSAFGYDPISFIALALIYFLYVVLTSVLVYSMHKHGAFQWISTNPMVINLVLILGFIACMYALFSAFVIKLDWATYVDQSISKPINFLVFTSYIWLPLLMLTPISIAVLKNDINLISDLKFKLPLIILCMTGVGIYTYFHSNYIRSLLQARQSELSHLEKQNLEKIAHAKDVMDILYFTRLSNEKNIRDAVWGKLISIPNWEKDLKANLEQCEDQSAIIEVCYFLSVYFVEQPQSYIEPLKKAFDCLASKIRAMNDNEDLSPGDLSSLSIGLVLQVIDKHYENGHKEFSDQINKIEETLHSIHRNDFKQEVNKTLVKLADWKKSRG